MLRSKLMAENMRMALDTIRTHKVRAFLTVLGVVIGVTVAIVVASMLLGLEQNVQESFNEFGVNNLWIFRFNIGIHFTRLSPEERMRKPLTLEDGMAIKEEIPSVKDVSIEIFPRAGQGPGPVRTARHKNHELTSIDFEGATANFAEVGSLTLSDGRFYTEAEDLHREDVTVIGYDVAKTLFPDESPIGKQLEVAGTPYTVIGIYEKKKNTAIGNGQDNNITVPYRTYRKHYPQDDEHFIVAQARTGMRNMAEDQIRGLLRQRRRVAPDKPDTFGISSAEALGTQFRDIMANIFQLVIGIVSVGLLVGGVGVMNIMLMGVTERTREIGVRKAIGARRRDISFQFLVEAMTLTGSGGVIGVLLSLGISFLMRALHLPSAVPLWAIILAVAVASSVGLFFGIYPAMKAARMDPVEALRYE
ncbi:MAG TPA: ABC transporter permease [Candidatus Angelobacter sp.]|nr:ABC transporter permease [Candidatus Angelobacter sp.]